MWRTVIVFSLMVLCLVPGNCVWAWNKAGHMVSGALAYQILKKESPGTIARVIALLKEHPEYEKSWQARLDKIDKADRDLFLFMMAARWADDARNQQEFHHAEWHYINFPFKPKDQPDSVKIKKPEESNILRAITWNLEQLKDEDKDKQAVALTWLFHLVGDIHQPLHTATLFSIKFPNGDRGGTRCYIRVKKNSAPISLHQYWDGLIIGSDRVKNVKNIATALGARADFARAKLTELTKAKKADQWAAESLEIAKTKTYKNGDLKLGLTRNLAEVLPEDYVKDAKGIAERRMILAGYRLADLLKEKFPKEE